jgi:protein-tyrosine phosphatase
MPDRIIHFEGMTNARDLGGLRTRDNRLTRFGQVIRSDTPARLSPEGWSALYNSGIRTIITLRTHGMTEPELDFTSPYADIATVQAEIEDITDREFLEKWAMTELWGTPKYYPDALQRWPGRHAAVISAIAQAKPGGVLFHCIRGHDRTGIISLLLLAFAGVEREEILADYALSLDPERDEFLARLGTSVPEVIYGTLDGLDAEKYLLASGVSPQNLDALRSRLLG